MRRTFIFDISFFPFTRLLVLDVELVNFNIISETISHILEILYITHILEVFINKFNLLALSEEIYFQLSKEPTEISMRLSARLTDTLLFEFFKIDDLGVTVLNLKVETSSFELFVLRIVVVILYLLIQQNSEIIHSFFGY